MNIRYVDNHIEIDEVVRPKKITGTKLASILGLNQYQTPFQVWCDITHVYSPPFEDNKYTIAGKTIEPILRDYVAITDHNVQSPEDIYGENFFEKTHGDFYPEDSIFGGMWDFRSVKDDRVVKIYEMKTTSIKKIVNYQPPDSYILQAKLYAYLSGCWNASLVVGFLEEEDYIDPSSFKPSVSNVKIFDLQVDDRFIKMLDFAKQFYYNNIVTGVSPDFSYKDTDILKEIKNKNMQINFDSDYMNTVESNKSEVENIVDKVVSSYTDSLTQIMMEIDDNIVKVDNPSTDIIEKYFLMLSNALYFVSERTERVGIYDDISKLAFQEAYNLAYLDSQNKNNGVSGAKKPTVAESTAEAENSTVEQATINMLYSRAYKMIKVKIDAAQTMVGTLSKIMSRRIQEFGLSYIQKDNSRQILNEEVKF